jgi:hypothetical protein
LLIGAAAGAVGLVPMVGSIRWRRTTAAQVGRLHALAPTLPGAFRVQDIEELPEPVMRYFRRALRDGQALVATVEIAQIGSFRTGAADDSWRPFEASQYFATSPPGLVWDARIRMAPFVSVRVRDAYIAGAGSMHAEILALYPVMDQAGTPELNAGALQRYLGEAVWFPTALLPASGVRWSPIDERRALATLSDGPTSVSLEFRFTAAGDVAEVFTQARFREVNGRYEATPWMVRCRRHEVRDGIRIPTECDVEWQLATGPLPYWRGRLTALRYGFAR